MLEKIFNARTMLLLVIVVGSGYLASKFPDEAVVIAGIGLVIVVGLWMQQLENN